jgi:hypothetical protein
MLCRLRQSRLVFEMQTPCREEDKKLAKCHGIAPARAGKRANLAERPASNDLLTDLDADRLSHRITREPHDP